MGKLTFFQYAIEIAWKDNDRPAQLFVFNLSDNDVPSFIYDEYQENLQKMMDRYARYVAVNF